MNSSNLLGPKPPGMPIKSLAFNEETEEGRRLRNVVMPYRQAQLNKKIHNLEIFLRARHKNKLNSGEMTNQQIKNMARNLATKKPSPPVSTMTKGGKRKTHKRKTLKRKTHKRR